MSETLNAVTLRADCEGEGVRWKDYPASDENRYKTMTLETPEFIRRFLLHVLPHRFHRIRHFGLFANGQHRANLSKARALLKVVPPQTPNEAPDDKILAPWLTCPACGQGMQVINIISRAPRHRGATHPVFNVFVPSATSRTWTTHK
jgi:hypothetical protein